MSALTLSISPFYNVFIWPRLENAIQASPPILSRDIEALLKVQKVAENFVKELRYVPYEAVLQQRRLFALTNQRIRDDRICMLKISHCILESPLPIWPAQGYEATPISCTYRDVTFAVANTLSALVLSRFGANCRPR